MWKEKLGAYLIELIYVLGLLVACSTLLAGLVLSNKKEEK